jgi:hypothetical protein
MCESAEITASGAFTAAPSDGLSRPSLAQQASALEKDLLAQHLRILLADAALAQVDSQEARPGGVLVGR